MHVHAALLVRPPRCKVEVARHLVHLQVAPHAATLPCGRAGGRQDILLRHQLGMNQHAAMHSRYPEVNMSSWRQPLQS
jgi:hypothetical protein